MKILLKNVRRLLHDSQTEPCDIFIENGKIKRLGADLNEYADKRIDCENHMVFPGFIDVHVHLREPGGKHKETVKTGTKAASRGGFTTICAMPNTNPVPDNTGTFRALLEKIGRDACVRVLPYASITKGLKGEELTDITGLARTGSFAFTDDGAGIQTADKMLAAMREAAAAGQPITAHCEDNSLVHGGVVHHGLVSERFDLPGLSSLSESVQIARDVLLAEATGCHYHVCHVSAKESVRVIRNAKRAGIHVTAEVTPHHLLLNEEAIKENDAQFKMNPPLRSKADQQALLEGLLDGTIDVIATDHAPHTEAEKASGLRESPFGIVGLETAFPLLYTYLVKTKKVTLSALVDWLTVQPAKTFQLPYGVLQEGAAADLTIVDLNKTACLDKNTFYSKGKNTPFHGWQVQGIPLVTIAQGEIVYREGLDA
ncbi:dihydroorotase [Lentibacillus salicampi]|uniref:Dihydroorotase n=1 Tax=Lentibacillus salicampi TaxID=175306 RepID=A0A4Y9AGT3_9BACI|nr:dihydroorotase [Lentibacillus salicampi]TFJ94582.1 dihydroorotase [Lentibacillus salicampi]